MDSHQEETAENQCHWHLHVCKREWVIWNYGPNEFGKGHVEPAETVLYLGGADKKPLRLPFELPKPFSLSPSTRAPQEIRRVTCWGYRFRTNDLRHDTGWTLAEDATGQEDVIKAAQIYLDGRSDRDSIRGALEDVREGDGGLW